MESGKLTLQWCIYIIVAFQIASLAADNNSRSRYRLGGRSSNMIYQLSGMSQCATKRCNVGTVCRVMQLCTRCAPKAQCVSVAKAQVSSSDDDDCRMAGCGPAVLLGTSLRPRTMLCVPWSTTMARGGCGAGASCVQGRRSASGSQAAGTCCTGQSTNSASSQSPMQSFSAQSLMQSLSSQSPMQSSSAQAPLQSLTSHSPMQSFSAQSPMQSFSSQSPMQSFSAQAQIQAVAQKQARDQQIARQQAQIQAVVQKQARAQQLARQQAQIQAVSQKQARAQQIARQQAQIQAVAQKQAQVQSATRQQSQAIAQQQAMATLRARLQAAQARRAQASSQSSKDTKDSRDSRDSRSQGQTSSQQSIDQPDITIINITPDVSTDDNKVSLDSNTIVDALNKVDSIDDSKIIVNHYQPIIQDSFNVKFGSCPMRGSIFFNNCDNGGFQCADDVDCPDDLKCCDSSCGLNYCTVPDY